MVDSDKTEEFENEETLKAKIDAQGKLIAEWNHENIHGLRALWAEAERLSIFATAG